MSGSFWILLIIVGLIGAISIWFMNKSFKRRAQDRFNAPPPQSSQIVPAAVEKTAIVSKASARLSTSGVSLWILKLTFEGGDVQEFLGAGRNFDHLSAFHSTWWRDPEVLNDQAIRYQKTSGDQYATILSIN